MNGWPQTIQQFFPVAELQLDGDNYLGRRIDSGFLLPRGVCCLM